MTRGMLETDGGDGPHYSYRVSAMGAPRSFHLTEDSLHWDTGRRRGRVGLDRVTQVRMSYRPATMQSQRFFTEIWSLDAPRLTIVSTSWKSMTEHIRQDREYRSFIEELHRRLARAGSAVQLKSGVNVLLFVLGVLVFAGASLGLMAFVVRAIQADAWLAAALIAVFFGLLIWHAKNYFGRNRPGTYRLDHLPEKLLPGQPD